MNGVYDGMWCRFVYKWGAMTGGNYCHSLTCVYGNGVESNWSQTVREPLNS